MKAQELLDYFENEFEVSVKIKEKESSFLMKILKYILFFNRNFMDRYITTIGYTVYWPKSRIISPVILAHELVHVYDFKRLNILFILGYLFPQILVVFALLAFISKWFLLFLIFLLPWPAPFRAYFEARAYAINVAEELISKKVFRKEDSELRNFILDIVYKLYTDYFVGSWYYFMLPVRAIAKRLLKREVSNILDGKDFRSDLLQIILES